jgi:hypothetical protein
MSKLHVFAVYDSKVEAYLSPFYMRTRGEAMRAWEATVMDTKNDFYKYPSDYTLFQLGMYDDSNGRFECLETPASLGTALEAKSRIENNPLA